MPLGQDPVLRLRRPQDDKIKIGHAGTLDPLASGVLPLALGEATKTVSYMMDAGKAYRFTVAWGEERDTDDREGKITHSSPNRPSISEIEAILPQFTGLIRQTPPSYSAIQVGGKRAYALARGGQEVALKAREVRVDSLEWSFRASGDPAQPLRGSQDDFLCHCGKGTYIRSLGRDMGRMLGCYGHISALRRLKVGNFTENDAISLEVLEEMVHKGALGFLKPVESALDDILALDLTVDQATRLQHGRPVLLPPGEDRSAVLARCNGKLIAMGEVRDGLLRPVRVFNL